MDDNNAVVIHIGNGDEPRREIPDERVLVYGISNNQLRPIVVFRLKVWLVLLFSSIFATTGAVLYHFTQYGGFSGYVSFLLYIYWMYMLDRYMDGDYQWNILGLLLMASFCLGYSSLYLVTLVVSVPSLIVIGFYLIFVPLSDTPYQ